jgi:hypothetical protein
VIETRTLNFKNITSNLKQKNEGPFQYADLIYTTSKLPLEDFFSGLLKGRFNEALSEIDITYHPSNIDNDLVERLVKNGITPVFLTVRNTTSAPVQLKLKNFTLKDRNEVLLPVSQNELPAKISRFSPQNMADNILSVTAGVLVVVAVIFVVIASGHGASNIDMPANTFDGNDSGLFSVKDTTVVTKIDYGKILLQDQILQPKQAAQGVIFFQTKTGRPPVRPILKLQFN